MTVSYYRRRAQAADTLMQMGRWFGFRQGYRDLVRLFIGTKEALDKKGRRTIDLYEAFGAICRDEEMFREELTKYASMDEPRITPLQVPPLVPSHMLRPTAKNRMYNAVVTYRNFGGQLSKSTLAPSKPEQKRLNHEALTKVLDKADLVASKFEARLNGRPIELEVENRNIKQSGGLELPQRLSLALRKAVGPPNRIPPR